MTEQIKQQATPVFSRPVRQVVFMMIVLTLVAAGLYLGFARVIGIFWSNPYLNGVILAVFVLGVLSCFWQVYQLIHSVRWIEGFATERTTTSGDTTGDAQRKPPSLLAPLATLLRARDTWMHLSSSAGRSILESVGQRVDEDREITRYIGNTLIFLGLLGTFYGLATTVPALVETIRSLTPGEGEDGADIFARLQAGLESQLGGMGTAFSSSLLGLAGSLVVGLLELFVSHGQNRFYRELEEWLSTITRVGFASDEEGVSDTSTLASFVDHLAEQMDRMQLLLMHSAESRANLDGRITTLVTTVETMTANTDQTRDDRDMLLRIAQGQEALIAKIGEGGIDGIDAESRMHLRSIDVYLLRILEEMSAGRQETIADLRSDIAGLARALKRTRTGASGDGS